MGSYLHAPATSRLAKQLKTVLEALRIVGDVGTEGRLLELAFAEESCASFVPLKAIIAGYPKSTIQA